MVGPVDCDPSEEDFELLIVGGGLSGVLTLLALLRERPTARVALIDRERELLGNHTWCIHESGLTDAGRALLEPAIACRFPDHEVRFPAVTRVLSDPYLCLTSEGLRTYARSVLERAPGVTLLLGTRVDRYGPRRVDLEGGRILRGRAVLDARGPSGLAPHPKVGFQKFLGLELVLGSAHGLRRPILMDATLAQEDGFQFMYVIPFDAHRVLVEHTTFSRDAHLDRERSRERVLLYASSTGLDVRQVVREEEGVLPMPWAGETPYAKGGPVRIGYGGGFFHPATGYSLPVTVRVALALGEAHPEDFANVLCRLRDEHEEQARYARFLNALLFRCVKPGAMRNVFERFYRLPAPVIARFYGLTLTRADRARILLGKPPRGISVRAALSMLVGGARNSMRPGGSSPSIR